MPAKRGRPPKPVSTEELMRKEQQECLREAAKTRTILGEQRAKIVAKAEAPNMPVDDHLEIMTNLGLIYQGFIKAAAEMGKGIRAVPEQETGEVSLEELVGAR